MLPEQIILQFGEMYAYEVDGFGNQLFMDDSNVPSLLSLPYLDAVSNQQQHLSKYRKFILSDSNPYFFKGKYAEGSGSPHTLDRYDLADEHYPADHHQ